MPGRETLTIRLAFYLIVSFGEAKSSFSTSFDEFITINMSFAHITTLMCTGIYLDKTNWGINCYDMIKEMFTCIKNAISITRLFRYPRTRLTTPLATVDDPMSIPS